MDFPDRLSGLIGKIENGDPVTQQDVDRIATLQALDMAKMGQDFVRDQMQRDTDQLAYMQKCYDTMNQQLSDDNANGPSNPQ